VGDVDRRRWLGKLGEAEIENLDAVQYVRHGAIPSLAWGNILAPNRKPSASRAASVRPEGIK